MVYTVSDNEFFSLICLQYGLPTLLFLFINFFCLHQFSYRMWRLQIWLHRLTQRFRFTSHSGALGTLSVDAKGFDVMHHYHDLSQDVPLVRLSVASTLSFGVVMLMLIPFLLLLAWGFIMWLVVDKLVVGIAIVLMGICLVSLYYAIQYWHSGGWRMTSHIRYLFGFSLGCYFLLAFVLSFEADGVSFFGQSVHFLTLNYILLTELISQVEKSQQIPAQTILEADDVVSGPAGATVDVQDGERLTKEQKKARQREAEKKFFAELKKGSSLLATDPTDPNAKVESDKMAVAAASFEAGDSDEEIDPDSDEAEEKRLAEEAKGAHLINIQAAKISMQFKDVLQTLMVETQEKQSNEDIKYQIKIYLLSLGVLLGYAFAIYKGGGPSNPADRAADGSDRYLGFIVSGILIIWDLLVYAYAANCGRVIDNLTKILILAGSRVALISFGYQGWFLGVVCLYAAAGFYLSYRIIDRRMPFSAFMLDFQQKECQTFTSFCSSFTSPENDSAASNASSNALLRTMNKGGRGGVGIAEFVLIILTVCYFMALCVSYQTNPPTQSLSQFTNAPWQQWEIGVVVWCIVLLWLMSVWTIRYWMTSNWRVSWRACFLTVVTQILFTLGGWAIFTRTDSVILIVCMVCGPLFVLALLGTYMHCEAVDWHLLQNGSLRNPPNSPFIFAFITCGLQRDDYRMMGNIFLSAILMCVIGLGITLGLHGSSIGWSITFILFILITSIVPLVKYLKTLTVDTMSGVLIVLWLIAHITFFALLYWVNDPMSDDDSFSLWGSCVGYPTILANILSYQLFKENGNKMNKHTAMVFMFTFILISICVIICFFTLGATTGGIILGGIVFTLCVLVVLARWVNGNYTLPKYIRWTVRIAFSCLLIAGVVLGVLIPDEGQGFWLFSGSWFLLMAFVAIVAYGDKARLAAGAQKSDYMFRYSAYMFPVYYFDRRNESNPVRPANLHAGLECLAFGMGFIWCAACMVTIRVNIGLGCSALCWVLFYTYMRQRTVSANKALMKILPYLNENVVRTAKENAREIQLSGSDMLFGDPQPNIFGLKRWGQIIHQMLMINLNPLPSLKKKQQALKRKLGLGRSCFCAPLQTDPLELDDHFILLERLNDWSFEVAKLGFKIEAHFYFLLLINAMAEVTKDQSLMKSFCAWLKSEKVETTTGEPVSIDPYISNYDIYDAPAHFSKLRIEKIQEWKKEYLASLVTAAEANENNRRTELEAEAVRQERLERREKEREERARKREEESKVVDASGNVIANADAGALAPSAALANDPTVPKGTDPVTLEFQNIIHKFRQTGELYEDPDFPANDESLYLSGERNLEKGSINAFPVHGWKRPKEILKFMAEQNPNKNIAQDPKVFLNGFALSDIVQGHIGTCYFLSAIGCLGLRELANPRTKLLTGIFNLPEGIEYNECGAFLMRFYRSGKEVRVIIDDRLPVMDGEFTLSHCRDPNEMWVALLEKAYAKLFTCYEAVEAGLISQALCDLSNGASQQIALKAPNGQLCVDPDQLWCQLEDSFASGYLIGAGSNSGSDTSAVDGIFQGHAYAVIQVYRDAAQTERLIQLQNPHGEGEWTGDWSDASPKWTQWWRNTLHQEEEKDDGKFWMSFQDFLQAYQNLYICRLLPIRRYENSQWRGHTAAGPQNPYHNPSFIVTTTKPCKVWIELEQTNKRGKKKNGEEEVPSNITTANGYAFIQFFVFENGGNRVSKIVKEQVKGCANKFKMVNERQISAEVFLDAPDTPFTIVCVTDKPNIQTDFTLSVFAADDGVQLRPLPVEDPSVVPS